MLYPRSDIAEKSHVMSAMHHPLQHVDDINFAHDFGISQLFIVRFSNGFQHDDKHSNSFQFHM